MQFCNFIKLFSFIINCHFLEFVRISRRSPKSFEMQCKYLYPSVTELFVLNEVGPGWPLKSIRVTDLALPSLRFVLFASKVVRLTSLFVDTLQSTRAF